MKYPTVNQILYVPIFTRSQILVPHVLLLRGRIFVELCWDMIMKDWCYHSCKWMVHMQFSAVSQDTQVIIYPKSLTWKLTLTYLRQQRKYLFGFSTQTFNTESNCRCKYLCKCFGFFDPVPPGPSRTLLDSAGPNPSYVKHITLFYLSSNNSFETSFIHVVDTPIDNRNVLIPKDL